MYRSVLAVIRPGTGGDPALDRAIEEAAASHSRLTLLCAVAPPSGFVCMAAVCRETLHAEALAQTERDLRAITAALPPDLPVTTVLAPTRLGPAVRRELARGDHDVVLIGAAARPWRTRLLARRWSAPVLRADPLERPPRQGRAAARLAAS